MEPALWQRSVRRHLIPKLPGQWKTARTLLYQRYSEWLLFYFILKNSRYGGDFGVTFGVELLAVPKENFGGHTLRNVGHASDRRSYWPSPLNVDEAAECMDEILYFAHSEALPYFDRYTSVEDFRAEYRKKIEQAPVDPHLYEGLLYADLIIGDVSAALHASEAICAIARSSLAVGSPWFDTIADRAQSTAQIAKTDLHAAVDVLRSNARFALRNNGIADERSFRDD